MDSEDLSERILEFAARTSKVVDSLPSTRLGRHIAGQLIGCGTSPMANYEEACGAESKKDFIHKMRICLKEVRESRVWMRLAAKRELVSAMRLDDLIDEAD